MSKSTTVLLVLCGIVVFNQWGVAKCHAESLAGTRPNIILVMTDDQGMGDLSCMGNPVLKTPNLDRFHQMATRWTDFHVSPTCAPSRSAIFSGRHEFRNGVTHTIKERERMALSTTTFPQLLQSAGYATGIFGKWHLGDEDAYQPYRRGFDEVFIHGAGGIGQSYEGSCADFPPNRAKEGRYFDNVLLHNDTIVQTEGYCTDVFFKSALGWIKEQHASNTPFFAYIPTNAPHGPMLAPDKYKQRFANLGWDANTQGRYGMLENIDDNFGVLLQKMDEWKLWDDTLLIFMTDNGQAGLSGKLHGKQVRMHTAGFKTGKNSPYEGGTHVPAFWCWKGKLKAGVDIPALTGHIDLFQTMCELAGAEIPPGIQSRDGRSLLPLLEDPQAEWPDRKLFVHIGRWEKGASPSDSKYRGCAVRTQRWRLVNHQELFDIANDPYEQTDVADDHPQVVAELRKAYEQWWSETLPLMVNEDAPYAAEQPQAVRYERQLAERGIPKWTPADIGEE
ncbi:arylsulfatase [Aureliella helgolandensis]|uniref:Arylsulfatase n=1 Tax=Aureliella helgolandensis TaxID=2527968 RepID=A0A518G965_9BACT|nr:arylsulfatase [Aureliella helgolandensis]QDV25109.1 Arylsulfatase [Aureliella helgolandensis]